ncbi:MAG: hypothetical protein LC734_09570, partial [Acidobacteria bacterium]|nr:hypothetical protein [Acidobacteriota bacterium]
LDFDWDKCLLPVSPLRRKWVVSAIGLAHKYLDLNIADLPFADEAKKLPAWLINAVEAEWADPVRRVGLDTTVHDPKMFLQQIRKRLPPNPIKATIDTEGEFDDGSRLKYQIQDIFKRFKPAARNVLSTVRRRRNFS